MKKIFSILLLSLLATGLFAQGAIEIANEERPVKVLSTILTENGTYDLTVMDQNGDVIVFHTSADTKSLLPISSFKEGDILAVKDNGISTMSLPPQMFATEIRNITVAKNFYNLSFKDQPNVPQMVETQAPVVEPEAEAETETETETVVAEVETPLLESAMWDVVLDDTMLSRFNYAYAFMIMENFKAQGLTLHASYFAKGILDFMESVEPLIAIEEMDPIVEQYITEIFAANVPQEVGPSYGSLDLVRSLTLPEELADKFAYSYGYMLAASTVYNGIDIMGKEFAEGILTSAFGVEPVMTREAMGDAVTEYSNFLNEKYEKFVQEIQAKNLEAANNFLADNKTREEVITLESGVQYEIITPGDGAKPNANDTVVVNYTLRTLDGAIKDQGSEVTFQLANLIPGFTQAAIQMHVGESITAYIPPALGYGEYGASAIEPNSLLIFDIELLEIVK